MSTEGVKNEIEVRNLYKSSDDPPSGIKSVTDGVLVSPFLLAVLGAGEASCYRRELTQKEIRNSALCFPLLLDRPCPPDPLS